MRGAHIDGDGRVRHAFGMRAFRRSPVRLVLAWCGLVPVAGAGMLVVPMHPAFAQGDVFTGFIETHKADLLG